MGVRGRRSLYLVGAFPMGQRERSLKFGDLAMTLVHVWGIAEILIVE